MFISESKHVELHEKLDFQLINATDFLVKSKKQKGEEKKKLFFSEKHYEINLTVLEIIVKESSHTRLNMKLVYEIVFAILMAIYFIHCILKVYRFISYFF